MNNFMIDCNVVATEYFYCHRIYAFDTRALKRRRSNGNCRKFEMNCPFYTIANWMRWPTNPGRIAISIHLTELSIIASCNIYRPVRTFAWQQRGKKIAVWLHRLVAIVHSGLVRSRTPSPTHSVRPLPIYCRCTVLLIWQKQTNRDKLLREGNSSTVFFFTPMNGDNDWLHKEKKRLSSMQSGHVHCGQS